jgi:hypothetical protein
MRGTTAMTMCLALRSRRQSEVCRWLLSRSLTWTGPRLGGPARRWLFRNQESGQDICLAVA